MGEIVLFSRIPERGGGKGDRTYLGVPAILPSDKTDQGA